MSPLTPEEREELQRRTRLATPGPWEGVAWKHLSIWRGEHPQVFWAVSQADEDYIKFLSPDRIGALLNERDALAEENRRLRDLLAVYEAPMECFECGSALDTLCVYCETESGRLKQASDGIKLRELRLWHMSVTEKDESGECIAEGGECSVCGILDCPYDDPLHYHHDGCPSEYAAAALAAPREGEK